MITSEINRRNNFIFKVKKITLIGGGIFLFGSSIIAAYGALCFDQRGVEPFCFIAKVITENPWEFGIPSLLLLVFAIDYLLEVPHSKTPQRISGRKKRSDALKRHLADTIATEEVNLFPKTTLQSTVSSKGRAPRVVEASPAAKVAPVEEEYNNVVARLIRNLQGIEAFDYSIIEGEGEEVRVKDHLLSKPLLLRYEDNGKLKTVPLTTIFGLISWSELRAITPWPQDYSYPYLKEYSLGSWGTLNPFLREGRLRLDEVCIPRKYHSLGRVDKIHRTSKDIFFNVLLTVTELNGLPISNNIPTLLTRYIKLDPTELARYRPGTVITEKSFGSTSKSEEMHPTRVGCNVCYYISPAIPSQGRCLKKIAHYKSEEEVLYPPYTKFHVLELTKGRGLHDCPLTIIHLREVPPSEASESGH